jgi:hypothetical protein
VVMHTIWTVIGYKTVTKYRMVYIVKLNHM